MPPKADAVPGIVEDLAELAGHAAIISEAGRATFLGEGGAILRHAADGILIKVHELCERLPEDYRSAHPDVPWDKVRGIRNRISHDYRATDYRIVWTVISRSIPELMDELQS